MWSQGGVLQSAGWCFAGGVLAEVQQYVRLKALECEECIFNASGQADAPEEPETTEIGTYLHLYHIC